jgi:hypothetical protein
VRRNAVLIVITLGCALIVPLVALALAVWLAFLALVNFSNLLARRVAARARNVGAKSPLHDDRPDVLYLRCFHADESWWPNVVVRLTTAEEDLATALHPFDLMAIGQPGDFLPLPGAARLYCTADEWRPTVCQRMRVAPLVILRAGEGEGLLWECEQAFTMLSPDRLVILVLEIRRVEYEHFAAAIRSRVGVVLPTIPCVSILLTQFDDRQCKAGFIMFSDGWRAQFVPLPYNFVLFGYRGLVKPSRKALRPVFAAHGVVRVR